LVIRRRAFGDLLISQPALEALAIRYPAAEIDLVVDRALVGPARAWSRATRVLPFPDRSGGGGLAGVWELVRFAVRLARGGYDLVVDLLSTPQTAVLARITSAPRRVGLDLKWRRWAYTMKVPRETSEQAAGERPRYLAEAMLAIVAGAGADVGEMSPAPRLPGMPARGRRSTPSDPPRVALAPGATWTAKAWPLERYRELARDLAAQGTRVMVFWGPGEKELAHRLTEGLPGVEMAPPGDLIDLAERLAGVDVLVSGDSGARHLAQAVGTATISLFGPTDPWTATPPSSGHRWLRYPISCSPCQRTVCPMRENHCLTRISSRTVFDEVRALCSSASSDG
jgi:ADP-heptose:LPS heptosyltransferase